MATAMSSGPAAQPQAPDRARGAAPYVEFEGIEKSYEGRTLVVRDLDLSVREGEFLTLLGPSGSGKTTCLMMLAGFETPTSGTIRIAGRSVHDLPPRQRNIGVVFQNYALFPHLTVEKNLSFPLDVRRLAPEQRRERVRRALQVAPPEILYEEPERPFVARFIGGNNLLRGRVAAVAGDYCRVDVAGRIVVAYRVAACAPGDEVTVAIRPERIGVATRAGVYRNQFPARVELITFLGDHLVIHAVVDGRTDYQLRIPNIVGHGAMLEGDEIEIGWAAADCRALDLERQEEE